MISPVSGSMRLSSYAPSGGGTFKRSSVSLGAGQIYSQAGKIASELSTYNSKGMINLAAGTPNAPIFADTGVRDPKISDDSIRFSSIDLSV